MKRYVREVANDCLRDLDRLERYVFGELNFSPEAAAEIHQQYEEKRERIRSLVEQCQYGYFSDLCAVKLIAEV